MDAKTQQQEPVSKVDKAKAKKEIQRKSMSI
jgi:hypothetical protein